MHEKVMLLIMIPHSFPSRFSLFYLKRKTGDSLRGDRVLGSPTDRAAFTRLFTSFSLALPRLPLCRKKKYNSSWRGLTVHI